MIRLPLHPLPDADGPLPKEAGHYLAVVLRAEVGEALHAFDPRSGAFRRGSIVSVGRGQVQVAWADAGQEPRPAPVVLVQGWPKGDKLSDIVRDATELGATLIIPALCARTVPRLPPDRLAERRDRLQRVADEAARQAQRAFAPDVLAPLPWSDAVRLASELAAPGYVLWESADVPVGPELVGLRRPCGVAFAIGPEGGLSAEEVTVAERCGLAPRGLGRTILRTETVAAAILGAWMVLGSHVPAAAPG